jgi:hypothetical protein
MSKMSSMSSSLIIREDLERAEKSEVDYTFTMASFPCARRVLD